MKKAIKITAAVLVVLIALLGILVGVGQVVNKEGKNTQQGSEAVKEAPLDQGGTTTRQDSGPAIKEASPSSGGTSEKARLTDSVEYTIRDARGNIKEHKVIGP